MPGLMAEQSLQPNSRLQLLQVLVRSHGLTIRRAQTWFLGARKPIRT